MKENKITLISDSVAILDIPQICTSYPYENTFIPVSASVFDLQLIKNHYWRASEGVIYTTAHNGVYEVKTTIESMILFSKEPNISVFRRDGNPYNVCRENLTHNRTSKQNVIIDNGETAFLILPSHKTVIIDSASIKIVEMYYWSGHNNQGVFANAARNQQKSFRIFLARILMGLVTGDGNRLTYKNKNIFDCRIENLAIRETNIEK